MRTRLPVRLKLAVVTAALTFGILCLFSVVIGAVAEQRIRQSFDDDLRATAADLDRELDVRLPMNHDRNRAALDGAATGGAQVRVIDRETAAVLYPAEGAVPLGPWGQEALVDLGEIRVVSRALVLPAPPIPEPFNRFGDPVVQALPVAYLQYGKSELGLDRTVARVRLFLAFGIFGGTLLAFLGGLVVAQRAMRPIAGLTRAAREVARTRDPAITLPKPLANDEVSDLALTLEDMLRELGAARGETEAALGRQRDFVADASHELRTPLTSILANLELLESELDGEQREIAESALRSSRRMRRLVADLLLLARADSGRQAPRTHVDLASVAAEAALEATALSAEHPLALDLPEPVIVEGVADDLHRLVANLLENAFIHTPGGTPVTVSVRRKGTEAVLEVSDRGPGVPPAMRERVFERFAGIGADARPKGGSGLGLAIVRAVAAAHRGHVELRDAEGGGARFVVSLPLAGRTESRRPAAAPAPQREAR
jgi:signal transduction histidine kinase